MTPAQRSERMARIRSRDTRPELLVRRLVFALGFRYRLHRRELPGCPDLVFRKRRRVIFIHGCFWHLHRACGLARIPKSRKGFWVPKLEGNKRRDARIIRALRREGWEVLTVWEYQLKRPDLLQTRVARFLTR